MLSSRSFKPVVLALFAPALLLGGCDRQTTAPAQPDTAATQAAAPASGKLDRSQAGTPFPEVAVSDASGAALDFASYAGKPVLVNLWATWCAPCIVELPTLDALAKSSGEALTVVTISQDMGDTAKVAPFLKEKGGENLPAWLDPKGDLSFEMGVTTLPMTILYDASGKEVWRYTGEKDWTGEDAAALIAEAG